MKFTQGAIDTPLEEMEFSICTRSWTGASYQPYNGGDLDNVECERTCEGLPILFNNYRPVAKVNDLGLIEPYI